MKWIPFDVQFWRCRQIHLKKIVARFFTVIISFACVNICNAQTDSVRTAITIKPEVGVFFPNDSFLRSFYKVKSIATYGIGLQLGTTKSNTSFLANFSVAKTSIGGNYSFTRSQVSAGVYNQIQFSKKGFVQFNGSLAVNFIREDYHNIEIGSMGLVLTTGLKNNFSKRISYFFDVGYDYSNSDWQHENIKDWSGFIAKFGFNVLVAGS